MDAIEFEYAYKKRGYTRRDVCKILGISPSTLSAKLTGKGDFTLTQLRKLSKGLQLTDQEKERIFFGD